MCKISIFRVKSSFCFLSFKYSYYKQVSFYLFIFFKTFTWLIFSFQLVYKYYECVFELFLEKYMYLSRESGLKCQMHWQNFETNVLELYVMGKKKSRKYEKCILIPIWILFDENAKRFNKKKIWFDGNFMPISLMLLCCLFCLCIENIWCLRSLFQKVKLLYTDEHQS